YHTWSRCLGTLTLARPSAGMNMSSLLDDAKRTARIDRGDMLGSVYRMADPFLKGRQVAPRYDRALKTVDSLLFVGMGGSASAGDLLADWLVSKLQLPLMVSRGPHLPRGINSKTLLVFLSYSGETWETLAALRQALRIGCPLIGVGSGGLMSNLLQRRR